MKPFKIHLGHVGVFTVFLNKVLNYISELELYLFCFLKEYEVKNKV